MTGLDPEVKACLVARLRAERDAGKLTSARVRQAAALVGAGERSVWRWLTADDVQRRPRRERYELTQDDITVYYDWRGNVAAVHRALHADQLGGPSLRSLQEAFARDLTPGERAAAVDGVEGRRRHEVYLRWAPHARNELWEGDHVELPVLVLAPRAQQPRKPWATLFIEAYSRLIMGWALSLYPTSAVVLAALRRGIVVDAERGPFGGLPAKLRPDNGLEFVAGALKRSTAALGVELVPAPAYTPFRKGKVERVNRTLDQEFLAGLPFYTHGPHAADGHLYGPDAAPMRLELFCDYFAEWVAAYNTERVHSELGSTPLARWCQDATPLREVAPERLRWMLMADAERVIGKDGIHFGGVRFIAPEINGLVGERVQVRYTPHDLRQIEVFRGDEWLATAYPQDTLTAEQREKVLERRRADAAELAKRQRRASRRARAKLAPITEPGAVEDTTTISAAQARAEDTRPDRVARRDADLRRLARTNLLDLKTDFAYWNPGVAMSPEPPAEGDGAPGRDASTEGEAE
ncbi:MAG: Mu transposase C-terminal domain-containing protein [Streptosporangiales bacterium]